MFNLKAMDYLWLKGYGRGFGFNLSVLIRY